MSRQCGLQQHSSWKRDGRIGWCLSGAGEEAGGRAQEGQTRSAGLRRGPPTCRFAAQDSQRRTYDGGERALWLTRLHVVHQLRDGQHVPQTVENTVRSQYCVDIRALSHAETGPHVLAHAAASVLKKSHAWWHHHDQ